MNPDQLAFGFLEYVVFLLSTTCHEAAHALVAKWGGDTTALEGGQVSLNPLPHIRREPFGMVVMPLLGIATMTGLIGWASAPYNPEWAQKHPKRAALDVAGGSGGQLQIGDSGRRSRCVSASQWARLCLSSLLLRQIVGPASRGGVGDGIATVLSIFFSLNILLGILQSDSVSAARWLWRPGPASPRMRARCACSSSA